MQHSTKNYFLSYVTGFVLSLLLTLAAYMIAVHHALPSMYIVATILALACLQFIVQMRYFLHLSSETASRDRLFVLCFAIVIVLILVSGSVWIMNSLNQRMMPTPEQMTQYMNDQTGI